MKHNEFEQIVEDFNFLDDWDDKYRYIIDFGKKLSPLDDALKNDANKVSGCASQVWVTHDVIGSGLSRKINFKGDSDAVIVKGLVAIVLTLYNEEQIDIAKNIDALAELDKLGLQEHLSSQRSNGLRAMIEKINITISSY